MIVSGMLSFQIGAAIRRQTFDKYLQKILENIKLISPPTVYIGRYSIVARITEYACSNSIRLFIGFLFENQASLNKRVIQLMAWLRIFVSARLKMWPVSTQSLGMLSRCSYLYLTGAPLSLWRASSKSVLCSYRNSPCTALCR